MDRQSFEELMHTLARAWSTGDPDAAVNCFTEDVVYVEPPDRQRYVGRAAVYELSGGAEAIGQPPSMSFTWHHLFFDPARQIGAGEYTYRGGRQFHGVALVQLRDDRISRWREYQYHDQADWEEFVGDSRFT
jgi:ketosteroid isomerase-like protein